MLSLIWLHTVTIVYCASFKPKLWVTQRFHSLVEFDRSYSTGLKKSLKTAQKTNVEPDMATYWFNSVIYMYFITNSTWHHCLQSMIVKWP